MFNFLNSRYPHYLSVSKSKTFSKSCRYRSRRFILDPLNKLKDLCENNYIFINAKNHIEKRFINNYLDISGTYN